MPEAPSLPVPSYAGVLCGLHLIEVKASRSLATAGWGEKKARKEILKLAFDFDPSGQGGSEGWTFLLRLSHFPERPWPQESVRIEWRTPSGEAGGRPLSFGWKLRGAELARAAGRWASEGKETWRRHCEALLPEVLEMSLFRPRIVPVLWFLSDFGGGKSAAIGCALPLSAPDRSSALGAAAVARGLLASDPLELHPGPDARESLLLDEDLSLLPPLDAGRKDRRGHGDGWLLTESGRMFSTPMGIWLAERMADLGLFLRGADPALGWRALTAFPSPTSEGTRLESRKSVFLCAGNPTAARREIAKGPARAGGLGLSFHEKIEILAEAEAACAALTGMRLDGSPVA